MIRKFVYTVLLMIQYSNQLPTIERLVNDGDEREKETDNKDMIGKWLEWRWIRW